MPQRIKEISFVNPAAAFIFCIKTRSIYRQISTLPFTPEHYFGDITRNALLHGPPAVTGSTNKYEGKHQVRTELVDMMT